MGIFSPIKRKVFSKIHYVCVGVCVYVSHMYIVHKYIIKYQYNI